MAIRVRPYGAELLGCVNLNFNLADMEVTPWAESIAEELMAAGVMDMVLNFLPHAI